MATQFSFLDSVPAGYHAVPPGAKPERCKSCGASIVWAKTKTGADIPINVANQLTIGSTRYGKTHFATCPQGRAWRRAR